MVARFEKQKNWAAGAWKQTFSETED